MEETVIEDEELKAIVEEIRDQMKESEKNIVFSEPSLYPKTKEGARLSFVTTDLDGNEIKSEDVFKDNKITMVNLWTSWCTWCIKEMPDLEEYNKELKDQGCGIIGVLLDGEDEAALQDALDIVEMTGATYTMLMPVAEITDVLPAQAFPTTYFVDSDGFVIGDPVIGADMDAYRERMTELLAEME